MPVKSTYLKPDNLNGLAVDSQYIPHEGAKAVPLPILDFSLSDSYTIDLLLYEQAGRLSMVQTLYVDMDGNDVSMVITVLSSGQRITCKGNTQGYYSILAMNPQGFKFTCAGGTLARVFLVNSPVPGAVWPTL